MDFEYAAKRLEKDQSKLRSRKDRALSPKAKKEAEYRRKQQALLRAKRDREKRQAQFAQDYFTKLNRAMGLRDLDAQSMKATSIHGDGDKIALPPAILERLTRSDSTNNISSPWTFRVGILNPDYQFPASPAIKSMQPPDDQAMTNADESDAEHDTDAYLEELSYKYVAYSYATVVEFTQEDGHVGLPASVAKTLLDPKRRRVGDTTDVPVTQTKDPAGDNGDQMQTDEDEEEKTPGHLAWGAFDLPDVPIELTMVTLPKGQTCELIPTMDAIKAGFHSLKDVKLVLEQSLVRTRATLSVGDVVHTWHRGVKYDLTVSRVTPADFNAVSCINTDITVDIGANTEHEEELRSKNEPPKEESASGGHKLSDLASTVGHPVPGGYKLSDSLPPNPSAQLAPKACTHQLRPEPPVDQKEAICVAQIRSSNGTSARRRFDIHEATLEDLFAFASTLSSSRSFQLVTRFPRRTFQAAPTTLAQAGIAMGQEMFMLEEI